MFGSALMTSVPVKTDRTEQQQQAINAVTPWVTVPGYNEKQVDFAQMLMNSQYAAMGLGGK